MSIVQYQEYRYLNQFQCIADKCEDNCCSTYQINLEEQAVQKYKSEAPELLDYVVLDDDFGHIFKSNNNTCALMDCSGLCSIHRDRGTDFLSDTCHFFPRVYSRVGKSHFITGSASCPEVSRILLKTADPFALVDVDVARVPHNVMGADVDAEKERRTLHTHHVMMRECQRDDLDFADTFLRILLVTQKLDEIEKDAWSSRIETLFDEVDIEAVKQAHSGDLQNKQFQSFAIFELFCDFYAQGFIKPVWHRLIEDVRMAFAINEPKVQTEVGLNPEKIRLYQQHPETASVVDDALKRYLAYEVSRRVYPYAKEKGYDVGVFASTFPLLIYTCALRTAILARLNESGQSPSSDEIASTLYLMIQRTEHMNKNFGPYLFDKGLVNLPYAISALYDLTRG